MSASPDKAAIRDAATVLLLDRADMTAPRVLMGQRGRSAAFMPSKFVFPGGVLDPEDQQVTFDLPLSATSDRRLTAEPLSGSCATSAGLAAAALRELAEETGLLCGTAGAEPGGWPEYAKENLRPDPSGLIYFFRAITPPNLSRRYDTRFFVMDAARLHGDRHDFSRASDELSNIHWVPLAKARELDLPFITEIVLAEVEHLLRVFHDQPLSDPDGVPFFDNRGANPCFIRIS